MKYNCRKAGWLFVLLLLTSIFPLLLLAKKSAGKNSYLVYVGTYTGPLSKGIYAFRFDPATGQTASLGLVAETANPSFLAADRGGRFVYAVNELSDFQGQKSGAVSAFSVDRTNAKLTFLNQVSSHGAGPCYITLDKGGKYALVANYDSGSFATFPVLPDGKLGEAAAVIQHSGHGRDPQRQEGPHAHEIELSPDNRFAIAVDLGLDKIFAYKFDAATGALRANDPFYAEVDSGSGPRHFAFTPDGKFGYVLAEMGSEISAFSYDSQKGSFHKLQVTSSLPKDFHGQNDAAEIVVAPSGKFVYASNRGNDSIAVFAIGNEGNLTAVEFVPTQGKTPRGFAIDPTGSYLFAANEASNNIVIFRVDKKSGRLTPSGQVLEAPAPVAVKFLKE